MIFGHGDDLFRFGDKVKINFSSNIYQKADLTGLKKHLAGRLDAIMHYPAPVAQELETMIAEKLGIPANMVMVTNGANEAIYLIAQLYRGWASVIPQPTYQEFADACRMFGHVISYERTDDLEVLPQDRIYWLCNPDNPTGNVLPKPLLPAFEKNAGFYSCTVPAFEQYLIARLIENGDFERHINRVRRRKRKEIEKSG